MNSLFLCLLNVTTGEIIVLWLTFMASIVLLKERQGEKKGRRKEGRKENKGAEEEFSRIRKLSLRNLTFCRCCQW